MDTPRPPAARSVHTARPNVGPGSIAASDRRPLSGFSASGGTDGLRTILDDRASMPVPRVRFRLSVGVRCSPWFVGVLVHETCEVEDTLRGRRGEVKRSSVPVRSHWTPGYAPCSTPRVRPACSRYSFDASSSEVLEERQGPSPARAGRSRCRVGRAPTWPARRSWTRSTSSSTTRSAPREATGTCSYPPLTRISWHRPFLAVSASIALSPINTA